jgi:exodeoxyribonuclease VII large subunit
MLGLPVAELAATGPQRLVWSVGALLRAVADAVAARFSACTVEGELVGFTRAASGHCYFSLKDADGSGALVRCAMFRRAASLLEFTPADGQRVELRGRVGVYEPRGELQLVVEAMRRAGAGSLYERFLQLKAKLEGEGLFDASRKRQISAQPRAVGVVTSLGAAALHDVVTTLMRRSPHVAVIVYPSLVQGAEAPLALAEAIALAGRRGEVDTLILCRGGGPIEDLWAFNDERVVRAIAACPWPVVCGVGHETDVTLSDFAADLRAATPTAAAELAAPPTAQLLGQLEAMSRRVRLRVAAAVQTQAQRLDRSALRMARPAHGVQRQQQRLGLLHARLGAALRRAVDVRRADLREAAHRLPRARQASLAGQAGSLQALAARVEALSPRQVLQRGYAWLAAADGSAVVSVRRLARGATVQAVLADGSASLQVTEVQPIDRAG